MRLQPRVIARARFRTLPSLFFCNIAGATGAVATADFVATLLPHSKLVSAPIGGFYFPPPVYSGPDHVPVYVDFSVASWSHICSVWQCVLPSSCAANHPSTPAACALANYSLHYTTVPTFVVESQADKISMLLHAGVNSTIDPPSQYATSPSHSEKM